MYGGNSNWRGPVWFPINYLIIRELLQYDQFLGADFTMEYPTGSGRHLALRDIAGDLSDRLVGIWLPGPDGRRPVYGGVQKLQTDPAWQDNLLFFEYFHGDNGAGLGAMHQTGWTALVADLIIDPPRSSRRLIFADRDSSTRNRIAGHPGCGRAPERHDPAVGRGPTSRPAWRHHRPDMPPIRSSTRSTPGRGCSELSRDAGARHLGSVPDRCWDELAGLGFDAVWLMGVWQRSPAGIAIALINAELAASFRAALPDWKPADVVGSPYCVRDYLVDDHLGGPLGLADRPRLAGRPRDGPDPGLRAQPRRPRPPMGDRPARAVRHRHRRTTWNATRRRSCGSATTSSPTGGTPTSRPGRTWFSSMRSPPQLRAAVIDTLCDIADQCDGVRCDMAMLDDERRVRPHLGRPGRHRHPTADYWPTDHPAVRARHPRFLFLAEAYWDLEWALQQQGFDFCYDKRLYDRLRHGPAEACTGTSRPTSTYQQGPRPVRGEPRRATGRRRVRRAADRRSSLWPHSPSPACG